MMRFGFSYVGYILFEVVASSPLGSARTRCPATACTSPPGEDQGYVRVVETDGKKVHHITSEGEALLHEHRPAVARMAEVLKKASLKIEEIAKAG